LEQTLQHLTLLSQPNSYELLTFLYNLRSAKNVDENTKLS
jgi:hypothetical protein